MGLIATRAAMLGFFILPALATTSVADTQSDMSGRFAMSPVDGGFLRLDKQTGAVSMCAKSGSEWACKAVDDQTASAPASKLSRLEEENRELKARIRELQGLLETQPPPPLGGPPLADSPSAGISRLPTDEEVDQALDYLSRVYKKIRDHVRDIDKPIGPDEHAGPPDLPPPQPPANAPTPKGSL